MTDSFHAVSWEYQYPNSAAPVLRVADARLEQGAYALMTGASGSGKTTFLRALNGLVPHFTGGRVTGTLLVLGRNPLLEGPARMARLVGMVFQDPESQGVLDLVEDEIALALENQAIPRAEMRLRIEAVMEQVGVTHLRRRALHSLSGGERQRVALACVLVSSPPMVVLDEPTSQLDPESTHQVLDALDRLAGMTGLTIIVSEHRHDRILDRANTIIDVASNRVVVHARADHPWDVSHAPVSVRLARHLGIAPHLLADEALVSAAHTALSLSDRRRAAIRTSAQAGDPVLQVDHLQGGYDDRFTIDLDQLTIHEGEVVVVMGRNGSGKSTLLKLIMGLIKPKRGRVSLRGRQLSGRPVHEVSMHVAYLPQDPNALLFSDTVLDEWNVTRTNHHLPRWTPDDAAMRLASLRLTGLGDAYPRDLSVGQRERAAIGAVTATQPGCILLDEPTRGLDQASKSALAELLRTWKNAGCAILIVTHDVEFTAEVADRVAVMAAGRLTTDGDPHLVLTTTPGLTPLVARVFPDTNWLTVEDVPIPGSRPEP